MAEKKPRVGTLEILVAVFAVVFIFSLVGVMNFETITGTFVETAQPVTGSMTEAGTGVNEGVVVTSGDVSETVSVVYDAGGSTAFQSGTELSPAWSNFEVMP